MTTGLSAAYESLHVNSDNEVTSYVDFPFPASAPICPGHAQMAEYLDAVVIPALVLGGDCARGALGFCDV